MSDELDEIIGKLSAAALQISPNDDQIIADHIRDSVALLLKYRHKTRALPAPSAPHSQASGEWQTIEAASKWLTANFSDEGTWWNANAMRAAMALDLLLEFKPPLPAAPQPAAAEAKYKDALERIALLDEADGHELTVKQAFEAIAIATSTLGKHPSEITDRVVEDWNRTQRPDGTWASDDPAARPGWKYVYVKQWRTLIHVPESIADEVRDALAAAPTAQEKA